MSVSAVPGDLDTGRGPPLGLPLAHFLVGLALLVAGAGLGALARLGVAPGLAAVARAHLLVTGWVCVTVMGAMAQFVPVWSGVRLYSRRLSWAALALVTAGLAAFAACLLAGRLDLLWTAGLALLAGFWTFAYTVGRTLARARPFDATEAHFALALGFLLVATLAGLARAAGYVSPTGALARLGLRDAHVTLAVLGVVLTTVFGALYQLAPLFAGTEPDRLNGRLRRLESVTHPAGVVLLAGGRLVGAATIARQGAVAVGLGAAAAGLALARTLAAGRGLRTPTLRRYAALLVALAGWLALALPAWLADPLASGRVLGGPAARALLVVGVLGLVVSGTLYHVVPFLVWLDCYSSELGRAEVPMVEELYDGRLAAADLACFVAGAVLLAAATALPGLGSAASLAGSGAVLAGACLLAANLLGVVRGHVPGGVAGLLAVGSRDDGTTGATGGD
jgi:hypothetical protein